MYLRFYFSLSCIYSFINIASAQCTLDIDTSLSISKKPTCFGYSDGSITVAVTGANGTVIYQWSANANNQTTATATGLKADIFYQIIVTDSALCHDTGIFSLSQPAQLTVATSAKTNVSCNGYCNGTATESASGGTSPYSYLWSNSGNTTASNNSLCAGNYSITVTDTNNCKAVHAVSITEPAPLTVSVATTDTCIGGIKSGSALVTAAGETSPYTYKWRNGSTSASVNNLSAGKYNVTVNDLLKCDTITKEISISEPAVVTVETLPVSSIPIYCGPGSATATVTGGTKPYTYSWSNSATIISIIALTSGTYTVKVTDSKNCVTTAQGVVTEKTCDIRPEPRKGFSPNDDNTHDTWEIVNSQYFTKMKITVFNRWGQKVHSQQGTYIDWDGKSFGIGVPDAAYYFILVPDIDNKDFETITGSVTIMR